MGRAGIIPQAIQSHGTALRAGSEAFQRDLVNSSVQEGIRIGRRIGFRRGVAVTLGAGVAAAAVAVVVVPEARGKAKEVLTKAQRRARDAVFRFRNRTNTVHQAEE